jgi:hypothetical protein
MRYIFLIRIQLVLICLTFALVGCAQAQRDGATKQQKDKQGSSRDKRVQLPADFNCPADAYPTMWEGKVKSFKKGPDKTEITIHADWDVDYTNEIQHQGSAEPPLDLFRLEGKSFKQQDWAQIEVENNQLRPNVRAKVLVCTDAKGQNAVIKRIDWYPPNSERNTSGATP